jgi:hypothetical protein
MGALTTAITVAVVGGATAGAIAANAQSQNTKKQINASNEQKQKDREAAEKARIAAEEQAEKDRLAMEKQAEQDRIFAEEQAKIQMENEALYSQLSNQRTQITTLAALTQQQELQKNPEVWTVGTPEKPRDISAIEKFNSFIDRLLFK